MIVPDPTPIRTAAPSKPGTWRRNQGSRQTAVGEREERAAEILTNEARRNALEKLSHRVLELRYGLGEHPRTLDEVGRTIKLTRERIRQIESQSLKKLQHLREARKLLDTPERFRRRASQISGVTPRSSPR